MNRRVSISVPQTCAVREVTDSISFGTGARFTQTLQVHTCTHQHACRTYMVGPSWFVYAMDVIIEVFLAGAYAMCMYMYICGTVSVKTSSE